jgi:cytochrome bd ubiquinol oxidase subunit II
MSLVASTTVDLARIQFATTSSWYTVFAGSALVLLFALHGAGYLTLRTTGELCERASRTARALAVPAAA